MSMHDTSGKRPIPTAVLVPANDNGAKPERPAPKRKAGRSAPPVPWVRIIAGGSVVCTVVVVVMALYAIMQERNKAPDGPPIAANAIVQVEVAPRGRAEVPQAEPFEEGDARPAPGAPKLPFRDVKPVKHNDAPPALEVFADEPDKPAVAKLGLRDVDLNLYANCGEIGTNVLFMKDPTEANKRAKAERKMVFIIHLSGNFEDKEFT